VQLQHDSVPLLLFGHEDGTGDLLGAGVFLLEPEGVESVPQ